MSSASSQVPRTVNGEGVIHSRGKRQEITDVDILRYRHPSERKPSTTPVLEALAYPCPRPHPSIQVHAKPIHRIMQLLRLEVAVHLSNSNTGMSEQLLDFVN